MKLRPYELKALRDLQRLFKKHKRILAVAPTGAGKTVIAASFLRKLGKGRVLWVAHRIELIRQAREQLAAAGVPARDIGVLTGPEKENLDARFLVASVDTMSERELPQGIAYVVIDEAHRSLAASYVAIVEACPKARILGLTATPWRLDGQPLGDVYEHLLVMAEAAELIGDGFIAAPICYGIPKEQAKAITKGLSSGKDFANKALGRAMSKRKLMGDIVSEWHRLAKGLATIVFAVNHEHAAGLFARFRAAGVATEYLREGIGDVERKAALARLASGAAKIIVNVDVLSEGFDCPPVKCIALARPTKSLTRFLQQTGRASRPFGAQRPIILDHAGNCHRFGDPSSPRAWSLTEGADVSTGGSAPMRCCDGCAFLMPAGFHECPTCGLPQPAAARELLEQQAHLERLARAAADLARLESALCAIASARALPRKFVDDVLRAMT